MGEQRNLTEENVVDAGFFDEQPSNRKIFEKLEALERQLNLIFDGHVLIDGSFQKRKFKEKGGVMKKDVK